MNPQWHADEAPWKAKHILRMLDFQQLKPRRVGEVGCGTGEVLKQLQLSMDAHCTFTGFDISPQAIELSKSRQNSRLQCRLEDPCAATNDYFDLLLVLDVLEHLEDYFTFLRSVKHLGAYKLFHFPLDLSVQTVLRRRGLLKRRKMYRHLHYFTKETALQILMEEHYKILHCSYVPRQIEMAAGLGEKILRWPRIIGSAISEELTARVLGGFSLFVLAN